MNVKERYTSAIDSLFQYTKPLRLRWFRMINFIPKRIRIVTGVLAMTTLMLMSTFFSFSSSWFIFFIIIVCASFFVTYVGIFEGISGIEWVMLFVMPVFLSLALYFAFSLIPVRWLTRIPFLFLFALLFYAVLLTSNIFNIGVERSLQLYRAAFSINYLLQTIIVFAFTIVIASLRVGFLLNGFLLFVVIFFLTFQLIWSVKPSDTNDHSLYLYGLLAGIVMAELFIALSFIPIKINIAALVVSAVFYSLGGVLYHHYNERLFKNIIREYIFVLCFVIVIAFLTIQW
ncbi:hypothetical protein KC726_04135 [Candidatus Woesebacteria bacterium]|nr:hypothetical protein [Candidatus Woesebacteria bacterium]